MLLLSACFSYQPVTFEKVEDVHIENIGKKGIQAQITAKIHNPNGYNIRIKSSDLQLKINSSDIGTAYIVKPVKIKKRTSGSYTVNVDVKYRDLAGGVLSALPGILLKKSVRLDLDGQIKGRVGLLSKKVDVKLSEDVNIRK